MKNRMSVARCCCDPILVCLVFEDDFHRLGWQWTQRHGQWAIAGNKLVTAQSDALLLCAYHDGLGNDGINGGHWVSATFTSSVIGDVAKIIVNYVNDDNYDFLKITVMDFGTTFHRYRAQLFVRSAGSEYQVDGDVLLDTLVQTVYVGVQGELLWFGVLDPTFPAAFGGRISGRTTNLGTRVALGTGTLAGTMTFTNFELYRIRDEDGPCVQMYLCTDLCEDNKDSNVYEVTLAGVTNGGACTSCADFNATFIVPIQVSGCLRFFNFATACWFGQVMVMVNVHRDSGPTFPASDLHLLADGSAADTNSGDYHVTVLINDAFTAGTFPPWATWNKSYAAPGPVDEVDDGFGGCFFANLQLPLESHDGAQCNFSVATCHVSAMTDLP